MLKLDTEVFKLAEIDILLEQIISLGASDLHLCSNRKPMIRLHGLISPLNNTVYQDSQIFSLLSEIFTTYHLEKFHKNNDTDFAYSIKGNNRFRVNVFRDKTGMGAVFRHIPKDLPTFDQISLEDGAKNLCDLNRGLVLVTGPTGSGKSTTLASMINYINNTRQYHIVTIEDPIEFVYPPIKCLIHQRELNVHTKSFSDALRTVLRQDPDVILVGEMRDLETTRLAIEASETGHLVFATLHTNTAYSTISRIINQFDEGEQELIRTMLADNLKGVVCQNLLRREDVEGKRIAAREIWLQSIAGANLIRENKLHQVQSVIDGSHDIGMFSLNASLASLVAKGIISADSAWQYSMDQKDLGGRLQRLGYKVEANQ